MHFVSILLHKQAQEEMEQDLPIVELCEIADS